MPRTKLHRSVFRHSHWFKIAAIAATLSFTVVSAASAQDAQPKDTAQHKDMPYLKYPTLPAFNIMLTDSITIFNTFNIPKGRPVALMLFDPECKHCKALTKKLLGAMDSISNIDFYLFTPMHDMAEIRKFYENFHLADYKNIKVIGRDYEFFFHEFYGVKFVPDIALYDKDKNLIKLFEANATIEDLYKYSHDGK
jgi:thiol-disulfide isomerase/thioredoxin